MSDSNTPEPLSPASGQKDEVQIASQANPPADLEKNIDTPLALQCSVSAPPYSAFSKPMKIWIICLVSISALISPFAATMYYPALNVLSDVLNISPTMTNVSITTYMIAQAIAPSIIGAMSDQSGRRLSFILCYVIFILANIGLALQTNYAALLILRMVQALGSSATIALTVAVVADLSTSAERGKFMGYATAGILFGPAFGPMIGGLLAEFLGWRSIFWFLVIFGGVLLVLFMFLFPETCRNVVGNGSIPGKGVNKSLFSHYHDRKQRRKLDSDLAEPPEAVNTATGPQTQRKFKIPNPLLTLKILREKESCIILLYNGLFFTGMMVTTTSVPSLFQSTYHLNTLQIGLCYISLGVGSLLSALTMGHVVDWNFRRIARSLDIEITKGKQQDLSDFPIERVRLQVVIPGHILGTMGLVAFGWTVNFGTSIAWPEVALFMIGFGVSTAFNITNTLLIDLHRDKPATATAAVNFVRCLMSAGGSVAIIPMCERMGVGWAYTLIAAVYVVLIAVVVLVLKRGMDWRREAEERRREREPQIGK